MLPINDLIQKQAKESMKKEILSIIDAVNYRSLTISIAWLADNADIHLLKSTLSSGMIWAQYDDFGKKVWTGISLKRELKGYIKKIKSSKKK